MTFSCTGIRRHGDDFILDGDLTIRGVTRPVSLSVEVNGFGPDPGGVMVSEKVQIEIEAVLKKD